MKKNILSVILLLYSLFQLKSQTNPWQNIYVPPTFSVVSAIASIGSTLYIGTNDGIHASSDLGLTWSNIMPTFGVSTLLSKGDTLYAGGNSMSGPTVAVSFNAGANWKNITPLVFTFFGNSIFSMMVNKSYLYIGATQGYGIYRCPLSNLQSNAWTTYTTGFSFPPQVACLGYNGSNIVASLFTNGVYSTSPTTAAWAASSVGISNTTFLRALCINNSTAYVGGTGLNPLHRSLNGGSSWSSVAAPFSSGTQVYAIAMNTDHVFIGTDLDGMLYSNNGGVNWGSFNKGFKDSVGNWKCTNFKINTILLLSDTIYAGTDCGLWRASGCTQPIEIKADSTLRVCSGSSATLQAVGNDIINWFNSSGSPLSIGTGTSFVTVPITSLTTLYAQNGTCAARIPIVVGAHPITPVSVSSIPTTVCVGEQATLTATGALSFTWSGYSGGNQIVVKPSNITTYTVVGLDNKTCINTNTLTLNVNPLPQLTIIASKEPICVGEAVSITVNGAANYTWSTGETGNTIIKVPESDTLYTVLGISSQNCLNSTGIPLHVLPCTAIDELIRLQTVRCIPNPGTELFNFIGLPIGSSIEILDCFGRCVYLSEVKEEKHSVNLSNQSRGVYYVRVISANTVVNYGRLVLN